MFAQSWYEKRSQEKGTFQVGEKKSGEKCRCAGQKKKGSKGRGVFLADSKKKNFAGETEGNEKFVREISVESRVKGERRAFNV